MHSNVKPDMLPVLKWIGNDLQPQHALVELGACLQVPDVNGKVVQLCGDLLSMHVAKNHCCHPGSMRQRRSYSTFPTQTPYGPNCTRSSDSGSCAPGVFSSVFTWNRFTPCCFRLKLAVCGCGVMLTATTTASPLGALRSQLSTCWSFVLSIVSDPSCSAASFFFNEISC